MDWIVRIVLPWTCLAMILALVSTADGHEPPAGLRKSLEELDKWLGPDANGDNWRKFLRMQELQSQLTPGAKPDPHLLQAVLAQFGESATGLEERPFQAVRRSLEIWVAKVAQPALADLPAAVSAAKSQIRPVSESEVLAAAGQLKKQSQQLDRFLGTGANGQAWRKFLLWNELQTQIVAAVEADQQVLDQVALRFAADRPGLELAPFADVNASLRLFQQRVAMHQQADGVAACQQKLDQLAADLTSLAANSNTELARQVGETLGWLTARGQVPLTVAAVRAHYCQPNFYLQISEPIVGAGMRRRVERTEPVVDLILGTHINGTGHTTGDIQVELVPNEHFAVIDSLFNGMTTSRTLGRNGSARIQSQGLTRFQARKRVFVNRQGIQSPPATAAAVTSTRTLGVSAGRGGLLLSGFADSIARDRVAQNKPRAEAISADHAEDRIRRRIDEEADPELVEANRKFLEKLRYPLLDKGHFPMDLKLHTSADYLYITGTQANPYQLGAPAAAPALLLSNSMAVRVHESAADNLAMGVLAGRTLTQTELQDEVKDLLGELPKSLESDPEKAPWTITFADQQPISVTFSNGMLKLVLRTKRLEGVVTSPTPWNISASYQLSPFDGGLKAVRQGEIEVLPPDFKPGDSLSVRDTARAANIQRRFEELLEAEIIRPGLTLPGDWEQAGVQKLVQLTLENGWLTMAWQQP